MQNSNLDQNILQLYADEGFTLFPLNGKIPPKGCSWPSVPYNPFPRPSDFPSGNFGVRLDADDLVIDVDPRNFPKDIPVAKLFQDALPFKLTGATFTVRTGGGGLHLYFRKPSEQAIRGAIKGFPGIEFKTKGQYLVGAGSIHPDTQKPYEIKTIGAINPAPKALLELVERIDVAPNGTIEKVNYVDDSQTRDRFISYLRTAPVAIEGQNGDNTTFSVAAVGHDFGLHPDVCLSIMLEQYNPRCEPPWPLNDLRTKVYNAYRYSAETAGVLSAQSTFPAVIAPANPNNFRSNQRGEPFQTVYNTVLALDVDMPDTLALNVWTEDIIFMKPAPWHREDEKVPYWTDDDNAQFKYFLGAQRRFEPKSQNIEEALVTVSKRKKFHPIKTELESYVWDGVPRINDWMVKYMGTEDTSYVRNVGLKVLVAAIKRLYEPGCKFDYIMVLEGRQGIGKSRAIQILGGEYYGDIDINLHDKETIEVMRRLWIIEASEMEAHRKQESTAMKAFLSRNTDMFRVPYAKRAKAFPRQSIFIGSVNPENCEDIGWLKDTTGNRRYWPVACTRIDIDALRKIRNQLWAEALLHYKKGTPIFFEDTKIEEMATREQYKRMGEDAWYERVVEWLTIGLGKDKKVVSPSNIYCDCLGGRFATIRRDEQRRIADIMRSLGWERGIWHNPELKGSIRGYKKPSGIVSDAQEILR